MAGTGPSTGSGRTEGGPAESRSGRLPRLDPTLAKAVKPLRPLLAGAVVGRNMLVEVDHRLARY
ncbi:MAG: hypothetical protein COZ43_12350 [Sphingomonadales bacterium CG_4_10_14_3_um_filter_58_15]|nr:MAG: hypothetical protein COZ43_12350 [Sphingomonadales bacterium CG_4_10_14_3_um_filter_58_15]